LLLLIEDLPKTFFLNNLLLKTLNIPVINGIKTMINVIIKLKISFEFSFLIAIGKYRMGKKRYINKYVF